MKRLRYKSLVTEPQEVSAGMDHLALPLLQAGSEPLEACVEVGQQVERGQCIATSGSPFSAFLHSPVKGEIKRIVYTVGDRGMPVRTIELAGDAGGPARTLDPIEGDVPELDAETLRERLRQCGVGPMGGNGRGARYAALGLEGEPPETLLVLCADEEPQLQTQRQVLREAPDKVIEGATLFQRAVGAGRLVFAAGEDQRNLVSGEMLTIGGRYPAGHPEILMAKVTGRYRLDEGRPRKDVFLINAETAAAACRAVREGRPVLEKVVTVAQDGQPPAVLRVPLGARFSQVLAAVGLKAEAGDRLFTGGPLQGIAQFDPSGSVTKGTDGLFLQKGARVFLYEDTACIGCGRCIKACPMKIPVNMMTRNCEFGRIEEALAYELESCIECGLCAYVCTARRPLLQFIQFAKRELEKQEREEPARQTA